MNNKFDELAKGLAQSATRRQALKKFGVGLAGMALAAFERTSGASAAPRTKGYCAVTFNSPYGGAAVYTGYCMDINGCVANSSTGCPAGAELHHGDKSGPKLALACDTVYDPNKSCWFTI